MLQCYDVQNLFNETYCESNIIIIIRTGRGKLSNPRPQEKFLTIS